MNFNDAFRIVNDEAKVPVPRIKVSDDKNPEFIFIMDSMTAFIISSVANGMDPRNAVRSGLIAAVDFGIIIGQEMNNVQKKT